MFWFLIMSKTTIKEEILKLTNERLVLSEDRKSEFSKIGAGRMDRNFVSKEQARARKSHEKARKMYTDLSSHLSSLQSQVSQAESDMNSAKDSMIDLNKILQIMDLTGATDAKKEKDGDCSYTVDGQKMYADTSDFMNIKLLPWKDKESMNSENSEDSNDTNHTSKNEYSQFENLENSSVDDALSFIPDDEENDYNDYEKYSSIESKLITKIAKKFR